MRTIGPWSLSGQLIVGAPEAFPNPKAEPMGKVVASLCWDYDGDCGATEYRIKWPEAEANGRMILAAEAMLTALESVLHQLSTDSDLDECVSNPAAYDYLEQMVRKAIAAADPGNPQLHYEDVAAA